MSSYLETKSRATKTQTNLNGMQKIFIRKFIQIGNATKAAILAGYSEKSAGSISTQLMANPKVKSEINRLNKIIEAKLCISQETLIKDTEVLKNRSLHGEPVYDEEGKMTDLVGLDDKTALAAIQTQARLLSIGGFGKTDINIDQSTKIQNNYQYNLESLSKEERNQLVFLLSKARVKTPEEIQAEEDKVIDVEPEESEESLHS